MGKIEAVSEPTPTVEEIREACCATWPKPCSYHEGWIDAVNVMGDALTRAELHIDELIHLSDPAESRVAELEAALWEIRGYSYTTTATRRMIDRALLPKDDGQ